MTVNSMHIQFNRELHTFSSLCTNSELIWFFKTQDKIKVNCANVFTCLWIQFWWCYSRSFIFLGKHKPTCTLNIQNRKEIPMCRKKKQVKELAANERSKNWHFYLSHFQAKTHKYLRSLGGCVIWLRKRPIVLVNTNWPKTVTFFFFCSSH